MAGRILVVLNNISDLKRLEQVRKDFIANVSHELKTPVTVISGFAETLLADNAPDAGHIREFSYMIYDEARRLDHLISRLLELSKLEAAEYRLCLEPVSLPRLIVDTVQLLQH